MNLDCIRVAPAAGLQTLSSSVGSKRERRSTSAFLNEFQVHLAACLALPFVYSI